MSAKQKNPTTFELQCSFEVEDIEAADGEVTTGKFSVLANTGREPMELFGFFDPVVIDLEGVRFEKAKLPIFAMQHGNEGVRFGHTTEQKVTSKGIQLKGEISGTSPQVAELVADYKNGFPLQASVGARIMRGGLERVEEGQKATVNGRSFKGPILVARKTSVKETTLLPLGADSNTSVSIAASDKDDQMSDDNKNNDNVNADDAAKKAADAINASSEDQIKAKLDQMAKETAAEAARSRAIQNIFAKYPDVDKVTVDGKEITASQYTDLAISNRDINADSVELNLLRSRRVPQGTVAIHATTPDMDFDVLECALVKQLGTPAKAHNKTNRVDYGYETLFDAEVLNKSDEKKYRNVGLHQLMDMQIRAAGMQYSGNRRDRDFIRTFMNATESIRAAASAHDVANLLENVANKRILSMYLAQATNWQFFSAIRNLVDFKVHSFYRIEGGNYRKVGNDGTIKHGALPDQKYTVQADTYAELLTVTRQDMFNDDLSAFSNIPAILGRDAALAIEGAFWKLVLANANAFFSLANNNLLTGGTSDFGIDGITLATQLFGNQVDTKGNPILSPPDRLFVNTLDITLAGSIFRERVIINNTADNIPRENPHAGLYTPYGTPYLNNTAIRDPETGQPIAGQDDNQWYLAADPNVLAAFNIGFLNGNTSPTIESSDMDFAHLGIQFRGYHDWGIGQGDPRGAVKAAGA